MRGPGLRFAPSGLQTPRRLRRLCSRMTKIRRMGFAALNPSYAATNANDVMAGHSRPGLRARSNYLVVPAKAGTHNHSS